MGEFAGVLALPLSVEDTPVRLNGLPSASVMLRHKSQPTGREAKMAAAILCCGHAMNIQRMDYSYLRRLNYRLGDYCTFRPKSTN